MIARAHTDTPITRILFLPYDSTRLVSCGRDNVRFWRLKASENSSSSSNNVDDNTATLRSCALNLSPYIQALNYRQNSRKISDTSGEDTNPPTSVESRRVYLEFTDLAVNSRAGGCTSDNLVYACTHNGQIFVINTARMDIENVRVVEPIIEKSSSKGILVNNGKSWANNKVNLAALKLNSLSVSDKFCVTGSEDGFVRVWPLDFGQVTMEAEHESSVEVVRFSPDCCKIATATLKGNLGNF